MHDDYDAEPRAFPYLEFADLSLTALKITPSIPPGVSLAA